MSIDVFGRVLKQRSGAGTRGPPGEGFKKTPNGDFDISHKRLCNVATPQEDLDAVNLHSLNEIKHEVDTIHNMMTALNALFEKAIMEWKEDLGGVKSLAHRNAELIEQSRHTSTPKSDVNPAVDWNLTTLDN